MPQSTFVKDLNARIHDAERIISEQNEKLTALRYLLAKESSGEGESQPEHHHVAAAAPVKHVAPVAAAAAAPAAHSHAGIDFKGRTSDIILALVRQSGAAGTRPRDIAATLLERKIIGKGSNAVHSHLSELRKRGHVKQNAEGHYVSSSKSAVAAAPAPAAPAHVAAAPAAKTTQKRRLSAAGREAIRKAQKARWAAARKAKA